MMNTLPINDHFRSLCKLICEDSFDGTLRQAAACLADFHHAQSAVILLLDAESRKLVVASGIRNGDSHWIPKTLAVDIERDRNVSGPLAQVALTGRPLLVAKGGSGYDLSQLAVLTDASPSPSIILPLKSRGDESLLGCAVLMQLDPQIRPNLERPHNTLILYAVSALVRDKVTVRKNREYERNLQQSLGRATQEKQKLIQTLATKLQQRLPGNSLNSRQIRKAIQRLANFEYPITIIGPDGCGKEGIASEIHLASSKSRSPFVVVNCRELNPDNIATLLYGYQRGTVAGVSSARKGYLREAGEGMVYFDRIDLLRPELHGELLRLIERCTFRPLGAIIDSTLNARLVFSSLQHPAGLSGSDLANALNYRISKAIIQVQPLSERPDDLEAVVTGILSENSRKHKCQITLEPGLLNWIKQLHLQGDKRELEGLLERAMMRAADRDGILTRIDFANDAPAQPAKSSVQMSLPEHLANFERDMLKAALDKHNNDRVLVAKELKIPKRTLADKCKKYQLS